MIKDRVKLFVDWLDTQGYYVGCYGKVLTKEEMEEIFNEFDIFENYYNSLMKGIQNDLE